MVTIPRAAELVAQDVRARIIAGSLIPGERIGSAADMQEQFKVSGPTLREALRILEAQSLVEISRGRNGGVRVRRPNGEHAQRSLAMVLQGRSVTLSDVHQARSIIEPAAVFHLAESKTRRSSVKRLRQIVEVEMECVEDPARLAAAMVTFHRELIVESGNKTLVLLFEILQDLLHDAALSGLALASASSSAIRRASIGSHLQVLDLIYDGRAQDAETLWRKHQRAIQRFMLASQAKGRVVGVA